MTVDADAGKMAHSQRLDLVTKARPIAHAAMYALVTLYEWCHVDRAGVCV